VDVRHDSMAAQAELGSSDSAALWASRTSSWWVGWIVPAVPQLLDLEPHCMLPCHWHMHFSMCLGQLKAVPVRQ